MNSDYYNLARIRKYNVEGTEQEIQNLDLMFPYDGPKDTDDIIEALENYYIPEKHEHLLIHMCYKNPYASTQQIYDEFRKKKYPDLVEPSISNYYPNSNFISMEKLIQWFKKQEEENYPSIEEKANPKQILSVLSSLYNQLNYTPNLERFLLFYPKYLYKFSKYRQSLFNSNQIDLREAYFLTIIVGIQLACPYMIGRGSAGFIIHGGPKKWILEKKYPKKLQTLFQFIRKLSRAPWEVNRKDFTYFRQHNWGNRDLLHYIQVISWAVSCCTISLAMGLKPDEPCSIFDLKEIQSIKKAYDDVVYESLKGKAELYEQIHKYFGENKDISSKELKEIENKLIEPHMKGIAKLMEEQKLYEQIIKATNELSGPFQRIQKRKDDNRQQFSEQYFINQIYPSMQKYLDYPAEKFWDLVTFSLQMTYTNFGSKQKTDTKNFRLAIQYYAEILLGMMHEEFSYKKQLKMNVNTTMPLRFYVRLLTLHPAYIKKQVLDEINHGNGWIQLFDLGHIALLVADTKARVTATMVYNWIYYD